MKRKLEKPRTDKELKEAYEKTFNYDPTDEEVAAKYGVSVARLCIRWCMQHDVVPLPKAVTPSHILDNVNVFNFEISPADMEILDSIPNFTGFGADIDNIQNELSFFVTRRKDR